MSSATATMNSSRASLSLVPNRVTTKSFAPGGWRSMTTWPTAATSDVAPGQEPGQQLGDAERGRDGHDPRDRGRPVAIGCVADVRVGLVEVPVAVLTGASSRVRCDIRVSRVSGSALVARRHPRPGPPIAPLDGDRQPERAAQDVVAQDGLQRTGRDRDPSASTSAWREPGRDLLDVM